jgi:hypothetical protein
LMLVSINYFNLLFTCLGFVEDGVYGNRDLYLHDFVSLST